ncbi:hypothetical protein PHAMO_50009 [Magnetospirillum molischianum DSM 120]|uniref:Uncharacterized protein n=1 Tax=Magnetospirillum molischianum DSM 120 TaxID=1150626 RepID=H8FWX6_MAGML|nr:hypothetical protein PHAMO_50009 [Magnetospirillum molischianum DSM 120]
MNAGVPAIDGKEAHGIWQVATGRRAAHLQAIDLCHDEIGGIVPAGDSSFKNTARAFSRGVHISALVLEHIEGAYGLAGPTNGRKQHCEKPMVNTDFNDVTRDPYILLNGVNAPNHKRLTLRHPTLKRTCDFGCKAMN